MPVSSTATATATSTSTRPPISTMALDDRRQRQDAAAERVQRGRVAASCTRRSPTRSCPRVADALTSTASSWSATTTRRALGADDRRRDRRRLRPRVPRPEDVASRSSPTSTPRSTTSTATAPGHTEAILTRDLDAGRRFTARGRRRRRRRERVDPLHRRRGVRLRRRDRHLAPRSCTPAARWACASSPPTSTSSGATARSAADPVPTTGVGTLMAERFASVADVADRLRDVDYLADDGIAGVVFLADRLGSRCSSRARPASARPSSPRRSPRSPAPA